MTITDRNERVFFNDKAVERFAEPPTREPMDFHRKLPGYEPSPLVEAARLAERLRVGRLWVKDESRRLGLPSFKILGASWGVYRALNRHVGGLPEWTDLDELRGALRAHPAVSLSAATDGNHGRAVARMAKLLQLEARIYVPRGTAAARIEGIRSEGASCEVVEGNYDDAVAISARDAGAGCLVISDTSWEGYVDVPRWVIQGYSTVFWEIDEQLGEEVDVVFVQIGVGALAAAAAEHFRSPARTQHPTLVGVEPTRADCVLASMESGGIVTIPEPQDSIMAGLNCGTPSVIAWPIVSRGYDACIAIDDVRAEEGMRLLAAEGIVAGETGAAGLGGLLYALDDPDSRARLGLGEAARVLLVSTEGATDPIGYQRIVGREPAGV